MTGTGSRTHSLELVARLRRQLQAHTELLLPADTEDCGAQTPDRCDTGDCEDFGEGAWGRGGVGEKSGGTVRRWGALRRTVSSGWAEIDRLLPQRGFPAGSLTEWFVAAEGQGGGSLALRSAIKACEAGGALVVVDPAQTFYPPAAVAWGADLRRLIWVRPASGAEALWAVDQALRCAAVKAVWSCLEAINDRWFRRFQLAAERGGGWGMLVRDGRWAKLPSWAETQLRVTALPSVTTAAAEGASVGEGARRQVRVELLRCRGSWGAEPTPGPLESRARQELQPLELSAVTGARQATVAVP